MTDLYDLDSLMPPSKKIKINGKILEIKPAKIKEYIKIVKLESRLNNTDDPDQVQKVIVETLAPVIPGIVGDDVDFTVGQIRELIKIAIEISVPQQAETSKEYQDPKKKIASPVESPTSSTSTQPTK